MSWQRLRGRIGDMIDARLAWPRTAGIGHHDRELLRQAREHLESGDSRRAIALIIEVLEGPSGRQDS